MCDGSAQDVRSVPQPHPAGTQQLALLRRKLDALGYSAHLDDRSAQLVQALVADLVHTTESYRSLKQQAAIQQHHISETDDKVSQCCIHRACTLSRSVCGSQRPSVPRQQGGAPCARRWQC